MTKQPTGLEQTMSVLLICLFVFGMYLGVSWGFDLLIWILSLPFEAQRQAYYSGNYNWLAWQMLKLLGGIFIAGGLIGGLLFG